MVGFLLLHRRKILPKNPPPPPPKQQSEQGFCAKFCPNNFRWGPDSCYREEGQSSREHFREVCANAVFFVQALQGTFDHDKEQKSAISGRRLHGIFLIFSSDFSPFLQVFCANRKEIARKSPQIVEKIARVQGGEKKNAESSHVCGCHGFLGLGWCFGILAGLLGTREPFPSNFRAQQPAHHRRKNHVDRRICYPGVVYILILPLSYHREAKGRFS